MKKKSYARILSVLCPLLLCLLFLSFGPGDPHPLPVLSRIHFFCGTKVGNGAGAECISGPEYISGTGWRSADDRYVLMPAGPVSWNWKNGQKTGLYLFYLCTELLHMGSALCIVCILHKMDGKKRYTP